MSSIVVPILLWIFVVELPLAIIKFQSSQKILQQTKECLLSTHPQSANIPSFLAQHSALASDTVLYKHSFRKASHIGMIVALAYLMTLQPWVLVFLSFALLGFVQDWEEIRKEQHRLVIALPKPPPADQPAGLALSQLRAQKNHS